MKKENKKKLLEKLRQMPIIQVACQQSGISRATYYRWINDDEKFHGLVKEAMKEGVEFINDMSETQLVSLIKDRSIGAIRIWLQSHHVAYKKKVEFEGKVVHAESKITDEDKELLKKSLQLALPPKEKAKPTNKDE